VITEEVYFNKGKLYKKANDPSTVGNVDGVSSTYFMDSNLEGVYNDIYPIYALKIYPNGEKRVKKYMPFPILAKALGVVTDKLVDSSSFDLCPSVGLWVMCSTYTEKKYSNYRDLWFQVENSKMLKEVADYYSLPFPLSDEHTLDTKPEDWHSEGIALQWRSYSTSKMWDKPNVKMASIVFMEGKPILLKMYKFGPKDRNYAKKYMEIQKCV
jgi:hypothetical protein